MIPVLQAARIVSPDRLEVRTWLASNTNLSVSRRDSERANAPKRGRVLDLVSVPIKIGETTATAPTPITACSTRRSPAPIWPTWRAASARPSLKRAYPYRKDRPNKGCDRGPLRRGFANNFRESIERRG
jgi:hypothetical protein